jgi:hypothetical protein
MYSLFYSVRPNMTLTRFLQACRIIHDNGGQVYLDGKCDVVFGKIFASERPFRCQPQRPDRLN